MTEISNSRISPFTLMTPLEEYNAWQDYGKDLERQKAIIKQKEKEEKDEKNK